MNFVAKLEQIKGDIQDVVSIMTMHETEVQALKSNKTLVSDEARYPIKLDEADKLTHNSNITADCLSLWLQTTKVTTNHYLNKRQVKPYGIAEYNGLLAIPIRKNNLLTNIQFINDSGDISYLSDTGPNGGYYVMGKSDIQPGTIIIGIDFIDVASAFKATGHMSVAAITKDNLPPVIVDIQGQYPENKIVILSNSGEETELLEAIVSANVYVVTADTSMGRTTFNNILLNGGDEALSKLIGGAETLPAACENGNGDTDVPADNNLLNTIIDIFNTMGTERIFSRNLVEQLNQLAKTTVTEPYKEKPLTPRTLANLLKNYQIKSRKIRAGKITGRGYYLEQFHM